jgi:hypothetical protein
MLLRDVPAGGLANMLTAAKGASPVGHLLDPSRLRAARRLARGAELWDSLGRQLAPAPIPVVNWSLYRQYRHAGLRKKADELMHGRRRLMVAAALGVWLGHPAASIDMLHDHMWAFCDDFTWVGPAHEACQVDLFAAGTAVELAEICHVLGGRLDDEVVQRVWREIDRRIFQQFLGPGNWWHTRENNWNHVVNGCIIRTILCSPQPLVRVQMLHTAINNMTYALNGFTDDGGCVEGPGYWAYGFGNYMQAADALYQATGGRLNIAAGQKVERICRFPLAAHVRGPLRATFADSSAGYLPTLATLLINRYHRIPELYEYCQLDAKRALRLANWHELALYDGARASGRIDRGDYVLPEMGLAKLSARAAGKLTVLATAGNNGVSHNHNDIGSFIICRDDEFYLTDPGSPVYTRQTFGPRRYDIVLCNSLGHSAPLINGRQQAPGSQFAGTLSCRDAGGDGERIITIDMGGAYPPGTVRRLTRMLRVVGGGQSVELTDEYDFARAPRSLQEAFITKHAARLLAGGRAVRVGPVRGGITIRSAQGGRFAIEPMPQTAQESRDGKAITRLVFVPARLARHMSLSFVIS